MLSSCRTVQLFESKFQIVGDLHETAPAIQAKEIGGASNILVLGKSEQGRLLITNGAYGGNNAVSTVLQALTYVDNIIT